MEIVCSLNTLQLNLILTLYLQFVFLIIDYTLSYSTYCFSHIITYLNTVQMNSSLYCNICPLLCQKQACTVVYFLLKPAISSAGFNVSEKLVPEEPDAYMN